MSTRFTNLHCKEVICLCDGRRLGFVCDANIDLCDGKLQAIIVPGRCRHFGVFGPRDDYVIPWHCIKRVGPDIILVDIKPEECRVPRGKPLFPL
ncbi:MAG: YlmC/YmxH family sporulation protein [Oscillospiraceae bacterium]|nr:YlmC/YmxH family sporulation protein [Oscillospiraceae bacterium]